MQVQLRGGRERVELYEFIIKTTALYGEVLTEHVGSKDLSSFGEKKRSDEEIFQRDISWIDEADMVLADVSSPSLGVVYEIAYAESKGKKIVCLYEEQEGKRFSAMIAGNSHCEIYKYKTKEDVVQIIENIFKN